MRGIHYGQMSGSMSEGMMVEGITQVDIEKLFAENVLAAEQLRRIVAERQAAEYKVELQRWEDRANGTGEIEEITAIPVSEG